MTIRVDVTNAGDMLGQISTLEYNSQGIINNSTLRHEEWIRYDAELVKVARDELNGIADLRAAGLTFDLGSIGTLLSMYETVGDMKGPSIDMDAMTPSQYDKIEFGVKGIPIPVFHSRWYINARQLEASRTIGEPLSTTQMEVQGRNLFESLETALFNGIPDLVVDGHRVYGYTNFPDRNVVDDLNETAWGLSTTGAKIGEVGLDGQRIVSDIKKMVEAANDANRRGPFTMYVSQDIWLNLALDYSQMKGTQTIYSRMLAFPGINMIKPSTYMEAGTVLLVQLTKDVVDLAMARDVTNQEILSSGNVLQSEFMMYTIQATRIKSDFNGSCGIVHGTFA